MGLLDDKKILVTGVLTDASLAFAVARTAQEEGATVALTGAGRGLSLTERTARRLPKPAPVLELDVTDPSHAAVALSPKSTGSWRSGHLSSRWSRASIARYLDLEPTITS